MPVEAATKTEERGGTTASSDMTALSEVSTEAK
jgi:hypothetical protein